MKDDGRISCNLSDSSFLVILPPSEAGHRCCTLGNEAGSHRLITSKVQDGNYNLDYIHIRHKRSGVRENGGEYWVA